MLVKGEKGRVKKERKEKESNSTRGWEDGTIGQWIINRFN